MAFVIADRIKETGTTTGTGALTPAGVVAKFRAFGDVCADGDLVPYLIEHQTLAEWEIGIGTYFAAQAGSLVLSATAPGSSLGDEFGSGLSGTESPDIGGVTSVYSNSNFVWDGISTLNGNLIFFGTPGTSVAVGTVVNMNNGAVVTTTGGGTIGAAIPNQIARNQVIASSNAGSLVNFSAGTKDISLAGNSLALANNAAEKNISATGTTQATAKLLKHRYNSVSSVTAGVNDGVKLPPALRTMAIQVANHSAATLKVYPATGESVEGLAINLPLSLYPGQSYTACVPNNGSWDGVEQNVWDDENNSFSIATHSTTPPSPPAGVLRLFVRSLAGRLIPAFKGPSGLESSLQPHMARNGWAEWKAAGTGTTVSATGAAALTATGTATAATYAATSLHTRCARLDYLVTAAAVTAVAGFRIATNAYRMNEGFHMIFRVAPATGGTVATRRFFCGMSTATTAPTDVDPSTLTNSAGVGYSNADTNWQIYFAGTAGAKVNTGIIKPSTDRPGPYTVVVFVPPGGASIGVRFTDETTGTSFESTTTTSTNMIATATACGPRGYHSVGGTSSVVGFTLFNGYMETDN